MDPLPEDTPDVARTALDFEGAGVGDVDRDPLGDELTDGSGLTVSDTGLAEGDGERSMPFGSALPGSPPPEHPTAHTPTRTTAGHSAVGRRPPAPRDIKFPFRAVRAEQMDWTAGERIWHMADRVAEGVKGNLVGVDVDEDREDASILRHPDINGIIALTDISSPMGIDFSINFSPHPSEGR